MLNVFRRKPRIGTRIAVLVPLTTLAFQPSVLNAINCFADEGYSVDVFRIRPKDGPEPCFSSPRINIIDFPITYDVETEPRMLSVILFTGWLFLRFKAADYVTIFVAGLRPLLSAYFISFFKPAKIVNLQLELNIGKKLTGRFSSLIQFVERSAIRRCIFTIIQDEVRAEMLKDITGPGSIEIVIVPNSPRGTGAIARTNLLKDRLKLHPNQKVLLSPGSFGTAFMTEEIAEGAQLLPENWTCVLHSAGKVDSEILHRLQTKNFRNKVKFSLEPVPNNQVDELFGSATIGLALYGSAAGPNTTEVGLASGKLCHFLKVGVPVIVSNYPKLRSFISRFGVGVAINSVDEFPDAIATIMADYEGFSARAAHAFTTELAFDRHFAEALRKIKQC